MQTALRSRRTRTPSTAAEMAPHARQASELLRALANEQRLMILCNLANGELSVGELNERIELSQSALSQHLAVLREAGLVNTRKDGQQVYYSLADGPGGRVVATLHDIYCSAE